MKIKKILNVSLFLIAIAVSICFIISYFIIFKTKENSLPISEIFPEDTPIFFGIDDLPAQLKKINESQTHKELDKLGFYQDLSKITKVINRNFYYKVGLSLSEIMQNIDKDAAIAFNTINNKLSYLLVLKVKKKVAPYQSKIEKSILGNSAILKSYKSVNFRISMEGLIICFYKNYFILSNDIDFFSELIDVIRGEKQSLAKNDLFVEIQKGLEYKTGYLGFINLISFYRKNSSLDLLIKEFKQFFNFPYAYNLAFNKNLIKISKIEAIGFSGNILGEEIVQKNYFLFPKDFKKEVLKKLYNNKIEKLKIDKIISNDFKSFAIGTFGNASYIYDLLKYLLIKNVNLIDENGIQRIGELLRFYGINFKNDFVDTLGNELAIVQSKKGKKLLYLLALEIKDENRFSPFLIKINNMITSNFYNVEIKRYKIGGVGMFLLKDLKGAKLIYGEDRHYFYLSNNKDMVIKSINAYRGINQILKDKEYKNCKSKVGSKNIFLSFNRDFETFSIYSGIANLKDNNDNLGADFLSGLTKIAEASKRECGLMKSGLISQEGFIINSYSPLSYGYALYLKEMIFILNEYLNYPSIKF